MARKNIQLPKKVTLGPFTCELLLIEHDLAYEVSEAQGASIFKVPYKAYFDKSIIELGGPDAVNVVIHEMLHVGFYQYNLKDKEEEGYEIDDTITENVIGFGEILPKGEYTLVNDILSKEEEELSAKSGDKVIAFDNEAPIDTILGVDIFPVIHAKTQEKIYVSLEDLEQ